VITQGVGTPIGAGRRAVLVSRPAISCRDPKHFAQTGCAPRVKRSPAASSSNNTELVLRCCTVVLLCCAVLCCTVVLLLWPPHRVTTPGCTVALLCCAALLCCTVALLCCAALLCCTVALLCCAALCYCSGPRPRVTTLSCHPVVRPHSQHRKVALRGTEVVTSQRPKTGQ